MPEDFDRDEFNRILAEVVERQKWVLVALEEYDRTGERIPVAELKRRAGEEPRDG